MDVRYIETIPEDSDVMTVEEFIHSCELGFFIDYDGVGHPAKDGKMSAVVVKPSTRKEIPKDATHIVWFNR
jgi:hypothetical protein